jgi:hypothetical protein
MLRVKSFLCGNVTATQRNMVKIIGIPGSILGAINAILSPIELRFRHFRQKTANFQDRRVYHPVVKIAF